MTDQKLERNEVLRGWEICRDRGAISVGRFAPTELGLRQAAADVKWLMMRHPQAGYELRALVSVPRELIEKKVEEIVGQGGRRQGGQ